MAVTIHSPVRCAVCGGTILAGERVGKAGYAAGRAQFRHRQPCVRPVAAADTGEAVATERQVAYALVVQDAAPPSERYSIEQLRALTRAQISRHISLWQGL